MVFYQSKYLELRHLPEIQALYVAWTFNSEFMTETEFKVEIAAEKKAFDELPIQYILANTLDFRFIIDPNLQEWHNEFLGASFAKIQKVAIIVSADLFSQVAVEQLMDDNTTTGLQTRYFMSEQEAIDWLKK